MCNSTATGSPTLPTNGKWWNVISLDNWGTAPNNWVSQLALPTPENEHIYYRRNIRGGTSIDSAPWIRLLDNKDLVVKSVINETEKNAFKVNIPFSSYRGFTGFLITRYGVHGITIYYGSAVDTATATIQRIFGDTVTLNGVAATSSAAEWTFKSNTTWNQFTIIGMMMGGNDNVNSDSLIEITGLKI